MVVRGLSLVSIKCKLDDILKQIFEIDIKIQEFKQQRKDTGDLEEAKCLIQQGVLSLKIDYELQKAKIRNKKKGN